jgi:hypothetical protein
LVLPDRVDMLLASLAPNQTLINLRLNQPVRLPWSRPRHPGLGSPSFRAIVREVMRGVWASRYRCSGDRDSAAETSAGCMLGALPDEVMDHVFAWLGRDQVSRWN